MLSSQYVKTLTINVSLPMSIAVFRFLGGDRVRVDLKGAVNIGRFHFADISMGEATSTG